MHSRRNKKLTYETLNEEDKNKNKIIDKELSKVEDELKKLKRRNALGDIDYKET